jgi:polygalacturonase
MYIQNYPVHCFSISNSAGLDIYRITLNNSAGYAPNNRSNGLPAAHNSDGTSHFKHILSNLGYIMSKFDRYISSAHRIIANSPSYLGFDLATTNNTVLRDSVVINQDDCVAVTSGNNILVTRMSCNGSHGLSIGSVGGKSSTSAQLPQSLFPSSLTIITYVN